MFECLNPMYLLMQLNCSKNESKYRALEHYISIALSTYSFHLSSKRPVMTASSSRERGTLSSTLPSAFSILSVSILISTAFATFVSQESLSSKSQFTFHHSLENCNCIMQYNFRFSNTIKESSLCFHSSCLSSSSDLSSSCKAGASTFQKQITTIYTYT